MKFERFKKQDVDGQVAPFTGAWIEIYLAHWLVKLYDVAPFTGAWIEIISSILIILLAISRSLHGSVD